MTTDGNPHVLAISGGSFRSDPRSGPIPSPLLRYALDLTGQDRPRVCLLATGHGDALEHVARLYAAWSRFDVELSHLALFPMPNHEEPIEHLLAQDLVYVSGGSAANLLALWRLHGLTDAFAEAWRSGVVLCGQSAGALCWHVGGPTDSFGPEPRPLTDGLGLLPHACGVHYDSGERQRLAFRRLVADGTLPAGYAADDAVGLHYVATELVQAVTYREGSAAYEVGADGAGGVKETRIEPRLLSARTKGLR